jgi:hypothetical protein
MARETVSRAITTKASQDYVKNRIVVRHADLTKSRSPSTCPHARHLRSHHPPLHTTYLGSTSCDGFRLFQFVLVGFGGDLGVVDFVVDELVLSECGYELVVGLVVRFCKAHLAWRYVQGKALHIV